MKPLGTLLGAVLLSVLLYLAVFSVIRRPLTVGDMTPILRAKLAYAEQLSSPKIVLFAGSNGRYSHRCDAFTQATARPCANLSLAVGVGLDFQFAELLAVLRPGDLVYLPLEYSQYAVTRAQMHGGTENALLVHDFRQRLWQQEPLRIARAYASFDLPFLVHGVVESGLAWRGYQRRSGAQSLTPQGDEFGHTAQAAQAYQGFLRAKRYEEKPLPADAYAPQVIEEFLVAARQRGARVWGGWPTVPEDAVVPDATRQLAQQLFEQHAQGMLALPHGSRYPLSCFFDTLSHLTQECQTQHSLQLGHALQDQLKIRYPGEPAATKASTSGQGPAR